MHACKNALPVVNCMVKMLDAHEYTIWSIAALQTTACSVCKCNRSVAVFLRVCSSICCRCGLQTATWPAYGGLQAPCHAYNGCCDRLSMNVLIWLVIGGSCWFIGGDKYCWLIVGDCEKKVPLVDGW
jgi:hypothetical protein